MTGWARAYRRTSDAACPHQGGGQAWNAIVESRSRGGPRRPATLHTAANEWTALAQRAGGVPRPSALTEPMRCVNRRSGRRAQPRQREKTPPPREYRRVPPTARARAFRHRQKTRKIKKGTLGKKGRYAERRSTIQKNQRTQAQIFGLRAPGGGARVRGNGSSGEVEPEAALSSKPFDSGAAAHGAARQRSKRALLLRDPE